MKTYYTRATHSVSGDFIKTQIDYEEYEKLGRAGLVLHMLHRSNLKTFKNIVSECNKYTSQEREPDLTEEKIAYGLCKILSLGLAKAVSIE